jgi:hypothetical protein
VTDTSIQVERQAFQMRKAGNQEQPEEGMARLRSTVVVAKFSFDHSCIPGFLIELLQMLCVSGLGST